MPRDVYIARVSVLLLPLLVWTSALIVHLHRLQIVRHEELLAKAGNRYTASATEHRGRGSIRDVGGNLLAGNLSCRDILAEPWRMDERRDTVIRILARELEMEQATLRERFEKACAPGQRYPATLLQRGVPAKLAAKISQANLPGVVLTPRDLVARDQLTGRIRELVNWTSSSQAPSDVFLKTADLRDDDVRKDTFATLSKWLGRSRKSMETLYQQSTRNRTRPVEITVRRTVPMRTVNRIRSYRNVRFTPVAAAGDGLDHTLDILARTLDVPVSELRDKALDAKGNPKKGTVLLASAVPGETVERIRNYHLKGVSHANCLSGLRFLESSRRFYPKGSMLANVIGFTNADGKGVSGIEEMHDGEMQPRAGRSSYIRDRVGAKVNLRDKHREAAVPGSDIYLTISEPIQQIAEEELEQMVRQFSPKAAYAVMMNPRTGAYMALAQHPTFNPNDRSTMEDGNWTNRVAEAGFEPGSVVKPLAVSGAIDFNIVNLDSEFDCEQGHWFFCGASLSDSGHSFDTLTVAEILQHSSNIGAAKIALAMGERRLYQTLRRYGFGQRTGIGFDHEATGIFRSLEKWDGLSISRFPIGQGLLTTPLQLVQAYAALANDGIMMRPYIVDRIRRPDGPVKSFNPKPLRRVVRPPAARATARALTLVTTSEGTAPKAAIPGYEVAGKTGTAQKWIDGQYSKTHYVSSFIGFVPAENPAFVLLVAADDPDKQKGYYAGSVAAPTFRRIAERTLRYLDVAPRRRSAASWAEQLSAAPENAE